MQDWSNRKKAALLILTLLLAGYILAQFLNNRTVTGIIAATAVASLLINHFWTDQPDTDGKIGPEDNTNDHATDETGSTDADTTVDSPELAVEPQSKLYSLDETSDTDPTDDTAATDEPREPLNRTGLRHSNDDILEETGTKLDDYVELKDEKIVLDGNDLDLYRRLMLYVVAKRMAYEDRFIDTAAVTVDDINDRPEFDYNKIEILLFLREAQDWLVTPSDQDPSIGTIDYADLDDTVFTVKTWSLSEIADWILEEVEPIPGKISISLASAASALNEAGNQYEKAKEYKAGNDLNAAQKRYDATRKQVLQACDAVRSYPLLFGRDHAWTRFTKYAAALLDDVPEQISHCLPELQSQQQTMQEKADDARVI